MKPEKPKLSDKATEENKMSTKHGVSATETESPCYCGQSAVPFSVCSGMNCPSKISAKDDPHKKREALTLYKHTFWFETECFDPNCASSNLCYRAHRRRGDNVACTLCRFADHVYDFCGSNKALCQSDDCGRSGHTSRRNAVRNGPQICKDLQQIQPSRYKLITTDYGSRYWMPQERV
jgi:hypothetical protein